MDDVSHPMNFLLTEDLDINLPKAGQIRRGTVVEQANNSVLVDIGAKSEGIIPNSEWETLDAAARKQLSVGNDVYVYVVDPEDESGNIVLSYSKAFLITLVLSAASLARAIWSNFAAKA